MDAATFLVIGIAVVVLLIAAAMATNGQRNGEPGARSSPPARPAEGERISGAAFQSEAGGANAEASPAERASERPPTVPHSGARVPKASSADPLIEEFYNSIAGVTFENPNGESRQAVIAADLSEGMRLDLRFEDDNPVDADAVAVLARNGRQIGYLRAELAGQVRRWTSLGYGVTAVADGVGRPAAGLPLGVRVKIIVRGHDSQRWVPTEITKAIAAAKREDPAKAESLLLAEIAEQEAYAAQYMDTTVADWPYAQLASLYFQGRRFTEEAQIVERYCSQRGTMDGHSTLWARLPKAQARARRATPPKPP
jgi:hypothetical protein